MPKLGQNKIGKNLNAWDIALSDDPTFRKFQEELVEIMTKNIQFQIDIEVLKEAGVPIFQVEIQSHLITEAKEWIREALKHEPFSYENQFVFTKESDAALFILRWK